MEIRNAGDAALTLTGWRLRDVADHTYSFPSGFTLAPGATVKVRTGIGSDTATDLYWDRNQAVWNNDGDVARLYDSSGVLIAEREG